jgi:hypothetical protein
VSDEERYCTDCEEPIEDGEEYCAGCAPWCRLCPSGAPCLGTHKKHVFKDKWGEWNGAGADPKEWEDLRPHVVALIKAMTPCIGWGQILDEGEHIPDGEGIPRLLAGLKAHRVEFFPSGYMLTDELTAHDPNPGQVGARFLYIGDEAREVAEDIEDVRDAGSWLLTLCNGDADGGGLAATPDAYDALHRWLTEDAACNPST